MFSQENQFKLNKQLNKQFPIKKKLQLILTHHVYLFKTMSFIFELNKLKAILILIDKTVLHLKIVNKSIV